MHPIVFALSFPIDLHTLFFLSDAEALDPLPLHRSSLKHTITLFLVSSDAIGIRLSYVLSPQLRLLTLRTPMPFALLISPHPGSSASIESYFSFFVSAAAIDLKASLFQP